jgi:hypothetical protein
VTVQPGDVVCTKTPKGWPAFLIRLGAALRDRPNTVNHVIVVHHTDAAGTLWGIEARPGGVGWVDMRSALAAPYTVSNAAQLKTNDQRVAVCRAVEGMLGTPYDWQGIAFAAAQAVHAQLLWASLEWGSKPPAHVVCSALADWAYEHVGLASPQPDRTCTPGDWAAWITERAWRRL